MSSTAPLLAKIVSRLKAGRKRTGRRGHPRHLSLKGAATMASLVTKKIAAEERYFRASKAYFDAKQGPRKVSDAVLARLHAASKRAQKAMFEAQERVVDAKGWEFVPSHSRLTERKDPLR